MVSPSIHKDLKQDFELTNISRGDGVTLWGHSIDLTDGGISCDVCEKSEEVPAIFKNSGGFKEVIYKLYILGKFKHEGCDTPDPIGYVGMDPSTNIDMPEEKHFNHGDSVSVDGHTYTFRGNEAWEKDDRMGMTTYQVIKDMGAETAIKTFGDTFVVAVVEREKIRERQKQDFTDTLSGVPITTTTGNHTIGDYTTNSSTNAHDSGSASTKPADLTGNNTTVNANGGDIDDSTKKSMKEKFASKLLERKGF